MDGNSWRPAQGDPGMASSDWRSELSAESRQRIVNKIMETLKKHLPISGPEGVAELNKIAVRFEEKIYTAATSQPDYLRKISLKMLTLESKSTTANPLASNSAVGNQNPQDPAVNSMQQARNQGQPLPLASQSQARQQILAQNLQNSIAPGTVQSTSNLPPTLSSMSGISQAGLSSVVSQGSTVQSISGISQNAVNNSLGQVNPHNMFSNSQRQLQARQLSQQVAPQQQQQQPQGQQHLLYQQHLQQQLIKQKLQQGNMQPSLLQQSQIQQQQSLLQPNQLQPSQQSHMQTSQQPSLQPNIQHQQQQQRLLAQQNLSSMHQQQQMLGPQSSIPSMHQQPQQLSQQSSLSGMQQSQSLLSQQSNVSSLQQHSHSIHQLLQSKSSIQHQQPQQASSLLMQQQSQQPHSQPSQQQLMPHIQSQAAQQQIALQQQASSLQRELQQRIQTGGLLQPQSAVEQQKPSFQPQRGLPETSSPSIESTAQSAHPAAGDWQEEIYQKLKSLKDMYYNELNELYQKLAIKCQQLATSPQILQHSSPQIDQQSLLGAAALPKIGTPLQPASSPFIVPSPSTPITPSPLPGDSEKPGASPLSKTGNIVSQQSTVPLAQAQSLAIGTPGLSASPLLAEFTIPDGNQGNAAALGSSSKSSTSERPFDRLIKAVSSISSKAFASSISDISSAVNLVDRLACSAPGNGSRASVGEDLAATTRWRLQARNLISQDGNAAAKKMKRNMTAMPLNTMSSAGSVNNSVRQPASLESSELESTATSRIKRPRIEVNQILQEEIKEINQKLIDTVVDISDEDNDLTAAATEGRDGVVIKCSYNAVALCPSMKSQYALAEVAYFMQSPILPLRLLVPSNYPSCSPVLLDMQPIETGKEGDDLSAKARSMFSLSVRSISHPMSLGDIARTWDVCARKVMTEYAHQSGGGSFSSSYGTWESCVSA
ncbi:Mediator of RNA polymerase II transcription subunit 15a [Nymphaea thermarum]|nr:Mediator of RNA polymerase II transcription subunit 15a [Nymphaea thermarum]